MTNLNKKRRGGAIVAALVLLTIILITGGAMLQQLAATQRAARLAGRKVQAQWLAESALDRALAKRRTDPEYKGETWHSPVFEAGDQGVAHIEFKVVDGRESVAITADFPDHPLHRARVELKRQVP